MPSSPLPSSPLPSAPAARARACAPSASESALPGSGDPQRLLDLADDARLRIEELLGHRLPAADRIDREEPWGRWELSRGDARDDRAVALRRPDRLGGGGEEIVDELLRL